MEKRAVEDIFRNFFSPFRNRQPDLNRIVPTELKDHLKCLDLAYSRMQEPKEASIARKVISRRPITNPELIRSYYPSKPMRNMNYMQYFMNLDASTLFFICYYFDSTKAQYLAAKVLKARSWMFNKKYQIWLKRSGPPKEFTKDFEVGSYHYFDSENLMIAKWDNTRLDYNEIEDNE